MEYPTPVNLSDVRRTLWTYTAATGNNRIKPGTLDRMFNEVIDAMDAAVAEYYKQ